MHSTDAWNISRLIKLEWYQITEIQSGEVL